MATEHGGRMQVWHGLADVPADWGPSAVSIGTFDGVHRGHRVVIQRLIERAKAAGVRSVVVTFDPHPMTVVRPDSAPLLLTTVDQRARLLGELGVDAVCVVPFTRDFSRLSPEEFVLLVLRDRLHALDVVVGENFRFGHRAAGDVAALRRLGEQHGFTVDGVELAGDADSTWSSSFIRAQIAAGDVAAAGRALGRPHAVSGVVVRGDQRGRELGFPTANLALQDNIAVPADGVYAGWLVIDESAGVPAPASRLPAATSVGANPTFGGTQRRVEAYALDRDDLELYGTRVTVEFVERLRGQVRFDDVADLLDQMAADARQAREVLVQRHFLA